MVKAVYYTPAYFQNKTQTKQNNISYLRRPNLADRVDISFASKQALKKAAFASRAMLESNPKWQQAIKRETPLSVKANDFRSEFKRDYHRIMHSEGNDRMRFKSQAYVARENDIVTNSQIVPDNDIISTRSTHIAQVVDISRTICKHLGLNEDLAEAIAQGHDLGHAPFGHDGEKALNQISKDNGLEPFWHEKNSLKMVDDILTLENNEGNVKNLDLTYAVRDGIICHCGEVDQNGLKPRNEVLDLKKLQKASEVQPYTWEGCVVKVADKIAYLGRDLDDVVKSGIIEDSKRNSLTKIIQKHIPEFKEKVNNSTLINMFTADLLKNSTPKTGIGFSPEVFNTMKDIKKFNFDNIYLSPKLKPAPNFYHEVLGTIFNNYADLYKGKSTINRLGNESHDKGFKKWLIKYSTGGKREKNAQQKTIYDLNNEQQYKQAIVDFISGMTDKYATKCYKAIKKSQKTNELSRLKKQQSESLEKGNFRDYKTASKNFAKEALENFEEAKNATLNKAKHSPLLSKEGIKSLKVSILNLFRKKTPEEKILKQEIKLDKMKKEYFCNNNSQRNN